MVENPRAGHGYRRAKDMANATHMTSIEESELQEYLRELEREPIYRFADWPNPEVPHASAGAYTVWKGGDCLYAGMSGRSLTADEIAAQRERGARRKPLINPC